MSSPGWQFQSDHIEHIRWMLDQHVCKNCKMSREDYDAWCKEQVNVTTDEEWMLEEGMNPYSFTDFIPENYAELSEQDKIDWLLSTACGCEYDFTDSEDPDTGKHFVEITV